MTVKLNKLKRCVFVGESACEKRLTCPVISYLLGDVVVGYHSEGDGESHHIAVGGCC